VIFVYIILLEKQIILTWNSFWSCLKIETIGLYDAKQEGILKKKMLFEWLNILHGYVVL